MKRLNWKMIGIVLYRLAIVACLLLAALRIPTSSQVADSLRGGDPLAVAVEEPRGRYR